MRHQHQRAGEFGEAVFQHFERGDIEIVGGLVEQQQVGGLQHEPGDQHARLFAAGEAGDRAVELAGVEEEALGPSGHVDGAVLKDDRIAVRAQSLAQRLAEIELLARLVEVDDAQRVGALDAAGVGLLIRRPAGAAAWSCRCRCGPAGPVACPAKG